MSMRRSAIVRFLGSGLAVLGLLAAANPNAQAQVFQTDAAKTPLPQPVGSAEFNLVTQSWAWNTMTQSYKDPMTGMQLSTPITYGKYYSPPAFPQFVDGDAITLQGLFKWRGEKIDPVKDAKTGPGYFSPTCGFSGQLLLLGGNCQVSFGWYNVEDPNSTTAPAPADIHEFIPSDPAYLNCRDENGGVKTDGFCPKAWDNRSPRDLSIKVWTPKAFDSGNIKNDPNYKGKYVGFAVIGNPAKSCKQNKYSMYAYNQKNAQGVPWVTTLIYHSTVDPEGFYMAFEDLPMSADDWHKTGVPGDQNVVDGDFNDFVFYISGINCEGGNQPCDTGLKGACAVGHTDCAPVGTTPACRGAIQPAPEVCDNVDNDCNGQVDDGDNLCTNPDTPFCFHGACVGNCSRGEFPCPSDYTCDDSGHCVDPTCANVPCAAGTACRNGACVDPCGGVMCPYGTQCQLGQCVDPCKGITCPGDRVCSKGLCVANCSCGGCDTGLTCGTDGRCVDTACANVSCMSGTVCRLGKCVDPCEGVVCPNGGQCSQGVCAMGSGTGGGGNDQDGGLNFGTGGSLQFGSGGSTDNSGTRHPVSLPTKSGCSCRLADSSNGRSQSLAWLGAAALALGVFRRRVRVSRAR